MSFVGSNILAGASGQGGAGAGYKIERSLRFNSSDSSYLSRQPSSAGNRRTWTWSAWVKKTSLSINNTLFSADASNSDFVTIRFESDTIRFDCQGDGQGRVQVTTSAVYRDPSAWYHIVVALDTTKGTSADRCKIYVNSVLQTTSNTLSQNKNFAINATVGHEIGRRSDGNDHYFDGYLADVHLIDGQALAPTDFGETDDNGVWQPKEFEGTYGTNGFHLDFADNSSNAALGTDTSGNGNTWTVNNLTASAPAYSSGMSSTGTLVTPELAFDGSTSTRASMTGVTGTGTLTWDASSFGITGVTALRIYTYSGSTTSGGGSTTVSVSVNGGTATLLTSLGMSNASTGWVNIYSLLSGGTLNSIDIIRPNLASSYNTTLFAVEVNGSILAGDAADIDSLVDSPTNGTASTGGDPGGVTVGNYATLNPLANGPNQTLSNGNLELVSSSSSARASVLGTIGVSSGKWYYEMTVGSNLRGAVGWAIGSPELSIGPGIQAGTYVYNFNAEKLSNGSGSSYGSTWSTGDVIGAALDLDAGTLTFYKNGTSLGSAYTSLSGTFVPITGDASSGGTFDGVFNFGQRAFYTAAPAGFKALCTANLPEPTIADGSQYFDTKLYDGTGSNPNNITGLSFSPDWVWIKQRSGTRDHTTYDTIRGVTKELFPNGNGQENTLPSGLTSFNSDGFTVSTSSRANESGHTYASWNWDAGSSNTTIAAGSLNSSAYDQSQTWSNLVSTTNTLRSGSGAFAYGALSTIFDGNLANGVGTNSGNLTLNFSSGISTSNSTVEVYIYHTYSATITAGGTTYTTNTGASGTTEWVTVSGVSGTITQITVNGAGSVGTCGGIRIDGKILVDYGVTPTGFPRSASTVRANPSAGFSIVTADSLTAYTEYSIGHSLNNVPQFIIAKNRAQASQWDTYHIDVGAGQLLRLNGTASATAAGSNDSNFSTTPTSSVFYFEPNGGTNNYVFYCFAPVEGYSAMGSFVGNNTTDGPFVYTGFKPAFVMIKVSSGATANWAIFDNKREGYNASNSRLYPNTTDQEAISATVDLFSNGFKCVRATNLTNGSSNEYIYLAFAEHPFKTSRAR